MSQVNYVRSIQPFEAPFSIPQAEALDWLMLAGERSGRIGPQVVQRMERMKDSSWIEQRRTVVPDYTHTDWERMQLFRPMMRTDGTVAPWYAPPLEARIAIYNEQVQQMMQAAYLQGSAPRYLIEVSCTGYRSPALGQQLLVEQGWHDQSQYMRLGHMGCYASMPALHLADQLLAASDLDHEQYVSIFGAELCTLHLRPDRTEINQVVANTLFADGAMRLDVTRNREEGVLEILGYQESQIPETTSAMTWELTSSAFHMHLDAGIPRLIRQHLRPTVEAFLASHHLEVGEIPIWAVHPGGPKVIESVQWALDLPEEKVRHSKRVLREYGNMSSCSLPYIWARMLEDPEVEAGTWIVSVAFGPGLTITLNLLCRLQ